MYPSIYAGEEASVWGIFRISRAKSAVRNWRAATSTANSCISAVMLADEQDISHCVVDGNIRLYMVLRRDYSCLQWSSPIAGCTARVVHQKIQKTQKCERVNVNGYLSQQDTECRKCALRCPSNPGEHGIRSKLTTGHIGAYYRSERPPRNCLLEHRKHVERLQKCH